MQKFFQAVSWIFHPVLMPSAGVIMLLNAGIYLDLMSFEGKRAVFLIIFSTTFLFPMSVIPFLIHQRMIKNITMKTIEERILPFFITAAFYVFGLFLLSRLNSPALLINFMMGAAICVFIILIISLKWKISAHMTGLGGVSGMLSAVSLLYMGQVNLMLMVIILISGLTATSRLFSDDHTPLQVGAGFLTGFVVMFGSFAFY